MNAGSSRIVGAVQQAGPLLPLPESRTDILMGLGFGGLNVALALALIYAWPLAQEFLEPFDPTYHPIASCWFAVIGICGTFWAWVEAGRPLATMPARERLVASALKWGALSAVGFALGWLLVAVAAGIVMGIAEGDTQRLIGSIVGGIFYGVFGGTMAAIAGVVVGALFGAFDIAVLWVVRRLAGFPRRPAISA